MGQNSEWHKVDRGKSGGNRKVVHAHRVCHQGTDSKGQLVFPLCWRNLNISDELGFKMEIRVEVLLLNRTK